MRRVGLIEGEPDKLSPPEKGVEKVKSKAKAADSEKDEKPNERKVSDI